MSKKPKSEPLPSAEERTVPIPGAEPPTRTRVKLTGPLTHGKKLSMARRVIAEIEELELVDQRGVIGLVGLCGGARAEALRRVLAILGSIPVEQDQADVVRTVSAIIGSAASPVARLGDTVTVATPTPVRSDGAAVTGTLGAVEGGQS